MQHGTAAALRGLGRGVDMKSAYKAWRNKLVQSGLQPIYEEGFCWAPFSRNTTSHSIHWFVQAERLLRLNHLVTISPWVAVAAQKL